MVSKENFVKMMKAVEDYDTKLHDVSESTGVSFIGSFYSKIIDDVINTLVLEMEPQTGNTIYDSWIHYYAWECDFGKRKDLTDSVAVNGKKIPLDSYESLYDVIIATNKYD